MGQQGNEGEILRYVFWHSIALASLVGLLVVLQAYVFPGMIPPPQPGSPLACRSTHYCSKHGVGSQRASVGLSWRKRCDHDLDR